jgi:uncharacterized GH25 family protein
MRPRRTLEMMFRFLLKIPAVLLLPMLCCQGAFTAPDLVITGEVSDATGKPIADAVVMVYHAGPTSGYSLFCPTCYADCGKRAITDSNGMFTLHHLSQGLWFELFVEKDGYEPRFVNKVVPTTTLHVGATLAPRRSVNDPSRVFRGRIVDSHSIALRDAVVRPVGALLDGKYAVYTFGVMAEGVDPIAVTNGQGDFEIHYREPVQNSAPSLGPTITKPPLKILVSAEARGMAPMFGVIPAGLERQTITVADGAIIRGRLVLDGRPVGGAEIGLSGRPRGGWGDHLQAMGNPHDELKIGTRPDGAFEIANVPAPESWYIFAKMESVATLGATGKVACATKRDDEIVDVGDLQLKSANRLRGRVVLSDGKAIPNGTTVTIDSELAPDSQTIMPPPSGRFEFAGLAAGGYSIFASAKGYSPPPMAHVSVEYDVDNFIIKLHPDSNVSTKRAEPGPR